MRDGPEPADLSPGFASPRVWIPFVLVTLIWGSTWLVIKDQVGILPAGWSITYRFVLATAGMFALAILRGDGWRLAPGGAGIAVLIGLSQFVGNFQFVYRAEMYLTSGIVAVFFGLLLLPNALLAWLVLGQRSTRRFLFGSAIAVAGIALLFVHEYRLADFGNATDRAGVLLGIALATLAMLSASIANIAQATQGAKRQPFIPLLAWAMLIGTVVDAALALALDGPPAWPGGWRFIAGFAYLGLVGSVATFPLYFGLIRAIGPGPAAYISVTVPPIAMLLSTLFEGYVWTPLAMSGVALAILGLAIAIRTKSKAKRTELPPEA